MRNKIAVAIIIIATLIPTVETCLAKQLPFFLLYSNLDNRNYLNFWRIVPVNDILYVQTHNDLYAYNLKENSFNLSSSPR